MRAIYIILISSILILGGCNTIEVAKEVTKMSKSVKTSIQKVIEKPEKSEKSEKKIEEDNFKKKKEDIAVEREKQKTTLFKQKKTTKINYSGKNLSELIKKLGEPALIREDGNTKTVRFDSLSCRFFVYFNLKLNEPKVEYYEIRNVKGNLVEKKNHIEKCLEEINNT